MNLMKAFQPLSRDTNDYKKEIAEAIQSIRKNKVFAFDIETVPFEGEGESQEAYTNPHTAYVEWVSVATREGEWDWAITKGRSPFKELKEFFFDPSYELIAHKLDFEQKFVMHWYYKKFKKWVPFKCKTICTMTAAFMVDENKKKYNLKDLTVDLLGRDVVHYKAAAAAKHSLFESELWRKYSRDDSRNAYDLWFQVLKPELDKDSRTRKVFYEIEMPNVLIAAEQELIGIAGNAKKITKYSRIKQRQLVKKEEEIYKMVGFQFNLNSTQQLAHVIFDVMKTSKAGLPRGKDGTQSTGEDVLNELTARGVKIAALVTQHRKIAKELSGFWKQLKSLVGKHRGIFYPSIRRTGQFTGRWFIDKPTLSTLPSPGRSDSKVRECVKARKGFKMLGGDWSQAELRIMAHLSNDPTMVKAFKDNLDLHQITADATGCSRQGSKAINFGLIYLMGAKTLQARLKKSSVLRTQEECRSYINKFFEKYPGIREFHSDTEQELNRVGLVRNPLGRPRRLRDQLMLSYNQAVRQGINSQVQSFVADWLKLAQRNIRKRAVEEGLWGPRKFHLLFSVHDEIVAEAPEAIAERCRALMQEEMENVVKLIVPLVAEVKIADNWYSLKG